MARMNGCNDNIKPAGDRGRVIDRAAFEKTTELEIAIDSAYDALMEEPKP